MPITISDETLSSSANLIFQADNGVERARVTSEGLQLTDRGSPSNITNGDLIATKFNGGQLAGTRNKIINGKMEISQRGTSFSATGFATLDRWWASAVGGAAVTVSQTADTPSNNEFLYSLRATVNTADTSIAAGDSTAIVTIIEGFDARDLIGTTFTLSFWVRSSVTGTYCVAFRNSGLDRSYVGTYTINAANTWEFKSFTLTGGLITTGTWDWTNGKGLNVVFTVACGTTSQTTAGAWQTGNFIGTSAQVNGTQTAGNIFAITGVQLEAGDRATRFEHRPQEVEFRLCERYYQEIGLAAGNDFVYSAYVNGAGTYHAPFLLRTPMRAAPIGTVAGTWTFTGGTITSMTVTPGANLFRLNIVVSGAGTWLLQNLNAGTKLTFNAELF